MKLSVVLLLAACGQTYQKPSESSPSTAHEASAPTAAAVPTPAPRPVEGKPVQTPKPAPAPPPPPAKVEPAVSSVAKQWVDAHNRHRAKHCAPPLTWSPMLAGVAQKWANTLKEKGCMFGHSAGAKFGENLAAGTSGALDPESSVTMWYDEVEKYKFPDGGFSMETGHFTQVVWTTTTSVGCGQVTCGGNDIIVCNYDPPGNWQGQYKQHVLPTSCKK